MPVTSGIFLLNCNITRGGKNIVTSHHITSQSQLTSELIYRMGKHYTTGKNDFLLFFSSFTSHQHTMGNPRKEKTKLRNRQDLSCISRQVMTFFSFFFSFYRRKIDCNLGTFAFFFINFLIEGYGYRREFLLFHFSSMSLFPIILWEALKLI